MACILCKLMMNTSVTCKYIYSYMHSMKQYLHWYFTWVLRYIRYEIKFLHAITSFKINYCAFCQFATIYSILIYFSIVYKGFIEHKHTMPTFSMANVFNENLKSPNREFRTLDPKIIMFGSQTKHHGSLMLVYIYIT